MSHELREPADPFAIREEELSGEHRLGAIPRREVRSISGPGMSPLLEALRSRPAKVTWIASQLTSPPLFCLLQTLDHRTNLHLDIVAPFGDDCFPDALSKTLAAVLEIWSEHWQLHILEGPTYPGHVFILDGRVLLCRDPLQTSDMESLDWVDADLRALPSLQRRLRRRRSACRLLAPGSLAATATEKISIADLPCPATPDEEERRAILVGLLAARET